MFQQKKNNDSLKDGLMLFSTLFTLEFVSASETQLCRYKGPNKVDWTIQSWSLFMMCSHYPTQRPIKNELYRIV